MRVVLGTSALLVFLIGPLRPLSWDIPTYITLVLYSLYGLLIYHLSVRRNPIVAHKVHSLARPAVVPAAHRVYERHQQSLLLLFLLLDHRGFVQLGTHRRPATDARVRGNLHDRRCTHRAREIVHSISIEILLAPIGLLIFGYIIARWGGYHTELKNRLKLLKEVTVFSNPRFGIDRTIKAIIESIRAFYDAETCVLVVPGKPGDADSYQMYRVARGIHPSRSAPPEIGHEAAAQFLSPSLDFAVIYRKNGSASHALVRR